MTVAYKFATVLRSHEQDVKAVAALSNDLIFSASRDTYVRSWRRTDGRNFTLDNVFTAHQHFVNSLITMPPSVKYPNGLSISGGSDQIIYVFDPTVPDHPLYTLVGHKGNVCALTTTPGGYIVSGSWDMNAIVWKDFKQLHVLTGHTASVWAVLALDDDTILTGSADKTIRLWRNGKQVKVFNGHQDAVRGLASVPGIGFVSCSNDGTLRVWTLDGECVQELSGHTSFVYSVAVTSMGEFVSSGEDRTVRVWKDGQCIQTIPQPCISVWAVAVLPNDDILVGGSDNTARIFTRQQERMADPEAQKQYEDALAIQGIPSNQVGDVNKEKLPGLEALTKPGNKEGQVIMVNANGTVEAHQWMSATQTWQKIGDVVGSAGSGNKQTYQGKEYDYVFDVDIGNGPNGSLKLPYNVTENPYTAAQNFIWRNELPQGFLDQIANFIVQNAKGVNLGSSNNNEYRDPFTGANSYRPSQQTYSSMNAPSQGMDPFTGASSYRSNNTVSPTTHTPKQNILPLTTYLSLKLANIDAIMSKLQSLNNDAGSAGLSGAEMNSILTTISYLRDPAPGGDIHVQGVNTLVKICQTWPADQRFPALDLLRLVALYSPRAIAAATENGDAIGFLRDAGGLSTPSTDKVAVTNAMLAYRGLANMFNSAEGLDMAWEKRNILAEVLQAEQIGGLSNKIARLAIATLAVK
ncbi:WD40-repeat-containing domain protein [Dichotomocladium elegans]|nr:WD40-repeat-containing domain protein [Dichotomocladium elegans]